MEYGNSEDPDSLINLITDDELVVRHNMTLVGLVPGSKVYYRVGSTDGEGNGPTVGAILSFRLRANPDNSDPIVTGGPIVQSGIVRWFTDEPADRTVVYGTASDPDSLVQELTFADFDRTHRVPILGLAPGTYFFRAGNTDASGNQNLTDIFSFSISADRDTIPPGMRAVTVLNVTSTTATIGWRTTEPADSRISWGLTTDYTEDIQREDPVRVHVERITDLLPDTLYHFKVGSGDFEGNVSTTDPVGTDQISRDYTFKTLKEDSDLELEFIQGPLIEFKDIVAIATWTTNRLANSKVSYGTPETFGTADEEVVEKPEFVRDHVVRVTNLVPGTEYFFRASSSDGVKTAVSVDPTLRTKPGQGLGPPAAWGGRELRDEYDGGCDVPGDPRWPDGHCFDGQLDYGGVGDGRAERLGGRLGRGQSRRDDGGRERRDKALRGAGESVPGSLIPVPGGLHGRGGERVHQEPDRAC